MRINLTDVDDRSFEAIPAGRYVLKITDYEMKETKGEGKLGAGVPMINWEFTVQFDKNGDTSYSSRKLWMNTVIHEKTLFNLKALLRATGKFTAEDLQGELDFEPDDCIGADVIGVVAQREYNGNTVNDVKRVVALTDEQQQGSASLLP
jgi:Protein of unknown function (DUF669)